jgi:hypothetical protein
LFYLWDDDGGAMENLNDLYYFAQTVEHGGFAPAGRAIGVPKSKLSRRVAALEDRLGVRLIHRSTRHFSTTETGQTYYEHCKAMLVEAEAAQEAIDSVRAEPRGVIRLACPVTLLHVHVGPFLAGFMRDYPGVTVHLEATNRRVDLVHEAVDVAIRVRQPPLEDSDLVLFTPSATGSSSAGTWSFYLDGSDCALTTNGEDIDGEMAVALQGEVGGQHRDPDEERLAKRLAAGTMGSSYSKRAKSYWR